MTQAHAGSAEGCGRDEIQAQILQATHAIYELEQESKQVGLGQRMGLVGVASVGAGQHAGGPGAPCCCCTLSTVMCGMLLASVCCDLCARLLASARVAWCRVHGFK